MSGLVDLLPLLDGLGSAGGVLGIVFLWLYRGTLQRNEALTDKIIEMTQAQTAAATAQTAALEALSREIGRAPR